MTWIHSGSLHNPQVFLFWYACAGMGPVGVDVPEPVLPQHLPAVMPPGSGFGIVERIERFERQIR
jgi:hypothetical protein